MNTAGMLMVGGDGGYMQYFCCWFVGFVSLIFQRRRLLREKKLQDTWGNLKQERQGGRGAGGIKGRRN